jgi:hypothetical protein
MRELRGGLDLEQEAVEAEAGGEFGAKNLQRNSAVVLEIEGKIDGGHPALPELALDGVAVDEGTTKRVENVHRSTAVLRDGLTYRSEHRAASKSLCGKALA